MKRQHCYIPFLLLTLTAVARGGVVFNASTAQSGPWSDPHTWQNQRPPEAGDFVQIRSGHRVVYDVKSDAAIRMIHVAGTLTFARDRSTLLNVGLVKIQPGEEADEDGFVCSLHDAQASHEHAAEPKASGGDASPEPALEIGSIDDPIPAGITATIRLVYFPGTDSAALPAIIDCGGRWDIHGAPMARTWLKLGQPARQGDRSIALASAPSGWKAGDRVIVTISEANQYSGEIVRGRGAYITGTEERIIRRIDGAKLTLDTPLAAAHAAGDEGRCEVANLSRNVVIESADHLGVRGHTMYHRNSSGGISYAEFRYLGKQGVLGKYPIHFHLVRDGMRGSGVIGASIWDSNNRFMAIHGTDYLLVRDCIGYQCTGHGFFLEDATEQYNILDRNLAVGAHGGKPLPDQALPFDQNEGAGFWWANGRNTLVRNVACDNDRYGFRFEINPIHGKPPLVNVADPSGRRVERDARTIPFLRFEDNESHSEGLYSFDFGDDPNGNVRGDASHPFIAKNLRAWKTHYALRPSLSYFLMDKLDVSDAVYGVYHPDYDQHVYRDVRLNRVVSEPVNRGHDDDSFQVGSFTYDGLAISNCHTGRDPLIQLTCTSPKPGNSGHFRNVTINGSSSHDANVVDLGGGPRNPKLKNPVPYYFHDLPAPGRALKVLSVKFSDRMTDGDYHSIPGFTGRDVRAAEIAAPPFPTLLDPIDDLPPASMITSITRENGKLHVRGVTQDNGAIASVKVNDHPARILSNQAGVADWEAIIDPATIVSAAAVDEAGNDETTKAIIVLRHP